MKLTTLQCVFISVVIAAAGLTTYFSQEKKTLNELSLANIEALAGNEISVDIDCEGLLGICRFKCPNCGFSYEAIGSHLIGEHVCH